MNSKLNFILRAMFPWFFFICDFNDSDLDPWEDVAQNNLELSQDDEAYERVMNSMKKHDE